MRKSTRQLLTRRESAALSGSGLLAACTNHRDLVGPLPPGADRLLASTVASLGDDQLTGTA